jgi:hypothetical protein
MKNKKQTIPVSAILDRTNLMLKNRFSVKHINYVNDNGIIKNGWLISKLEAIDESIQLLHKQNAPIYILGKFANAVIHWDSKRIEVIGSLYKNGKEIEKFNENNFDKIKNKLIEWFNISTKG